jgi:hypothetical protein
MMAAQGKATASAPAAPPRSIGSAASRAHSTIEASLQGQLPVAQAMQQEQAADPARQDAP